jgi:iron complex outermembrane receptor protein
MKNQRTRLSRAIALTLATSTLSVFSLASGSAQATEAQAATSKSVGERTGTRVSQSDASRVQAVVVFDRQAIDASGATTLADFLRSTAFNSFGSFRPQSGSSAQSFSEISLRGLTRGRNLVLVDGRRVTGSPAITFGLGQDLNSVPLAAVERIEILADGASAIYGSEAISGVINVITRKNFEGAEFSIGAGNPSRAGGETEEGSFIFGASGDRGSLTAGAAYSNRGIILQRERDYSAGGASTFSNNLLNATPAPGTPFGFTQGGFVNNLTFGSRLPGFDCDSNGFFSTATRCFYDFTTDAADEAELHGQSLFVRGNYQVNDDWSTYLAADVTRTSSFGRYAPVPSSPWPGGAPFIPVDSPNHPAVRFPNAGYDATRPYFLRHRFAALGTRDTSTEQNNYNLNFGVTGTLGAFAIDAGVRHSEQQYYELGRNYVVGGLAQAAIADGSYDIYDPFGVPRSVLDSIVATVNRDATSQIQEIYASASIDLFEMGGGATTLGFGADYRDESYADIYDTLQSSGQIVGSNGNSGSGERAVKAVYAEFLMPVLDNLDVSLAGRFDDYNDYGSDFSPKIALRYQPIESLTLRASYSQGFQAPAIGVVSPPATRTLGTVFDTIYCAQIGAPICEPYFVDVYTVANPELDAEHSDQWSAGLEWQANDWLNLSFNYYDISIDDLITRISISDIYGCLALGRVCPAGVTLFPSGASPTDPTLGLGIGRGPNGEITFIRTGYVNSGTQETDGIDLSASTHFDIGSWGSISNQLQISRVGAFRVVASDNLVDYPSFPQFRAQLSTTWNIGDFSFAWIVHHIDGTRSQAGVNASQGFSDYGYAHRLPSWTTHDLQAAWNAPWDGRLVLGVTNIADKGPVLDPLQPTGRPFDMDLYDGYGRVPYMRYTQSF